MLVHSIVSLFLILILPSPPNPDPLLENYNHLHSMENIVLVKLNMEIKLFLV